jgi:hypothetical protein
MKRCSKCGETKSISEFPKNRGKKDGIHSWCRKCHYESNYKHKMGLRDFARKLKEAPCFDCKKTYPWCVMEFDHTRGVKLFEVTSLHQFGSKKKLLDEIKKCDVICANCHTIRTYKRSQVLR